MSPKRFSAHRRGFSLVEIGIVLGIIGFVLGGIYFTLSSTADVGKREQMFEAIASTVTGTRALYVPNGGIPLVGFSSTTSTLIADGVVPQKMKRTASCANVNNLCADTPWGPKDGAAMSPNGTFRVFGWDFTGKIAAGSTVQSFAVELRGLSNGNCSMVTEQVTAAVGPTGLLAVVINGNPIGPTAAAPRPIQPVAPHDADANCTTGANSVDFIYAINSGSSR